MKPGRWTLRHLPITPGKPADERRAKCFCILGGPAAEVVGERAIAQTKMTMSQRGMVEGAQGPGLCDVACTGCFHEPD
jgi:hypothetical protein